MKIGHRMAEQHWNYHFGDDATIYLRHLRCYDRQLPLDGTVGMSSSRRVGIMWQSTFGAATLQHLPSSPKMTALDIF